MTLKFGSAHALYLQCDDDGNVVHNKNNPAYKYEWVVVLLYPRATLFQGDTYKSSATLSYAILIATSVECHSDI